MYIRANMLHPRADFLLNIPPDHYYISPRRLLFFRILNPHYFTFQFHHEKYSHSLHLYLIFLFIYLLITFYRFL